MPKRFLLSLISGVIIALMLVGCGANTSSKESTSTESNQPDAAASTSSESQEPAKIQVVYYGDQSNRMKEFAANELKERLLKDLNIELTLTYLSWDDCGAGKTDLMMASGEDFASYTDPRTAATKIAKGMYADLTKSAETNIPDLKKVVQPEAFDTFVFNGKLYAIPIGNKPTSAAFYSVLVRQDLLEEVGMKEIKTLDDMEKFYELCKAKHPDYQGSSYVGNYRTMFSYIISDKNLEIFDGNYVIADASTKDDKLYSWYESEEFKKLAEINSKWVQKGIIPKYTLTNPNQGLSDWYAGKMMWASGNSGRPLEMIDKIRENNPEAQLKNYFLGDRPKINTNLCNTAYYVSAGSENVDAYLRLFNYMQQNQDNYDFMMYGVKDRDYTIEGDRVVKKNTEPLFDDWMLENKNFVRFPKEVSQDFIDAYKKWDDNCILGKNVGFTFDGESVKTEKAKLDAISKQFGEPIEFGFVPYQGNYDKMIKKMKDAGLDNYIAEMQKQFTAYRASKK